MWITTDFQNGADKFFQLKDASSGGNVVNMYSQVANIRTSIAMDQPADSNGDLYVKFEDSNWSSIVINIKGVKLR